MKRLRVLVCAFTCCPPGLPGFTGGEDTLGWNLMKQIARSHDLWVITHEEDRETLEKALAEDPSTNIRMCYVSMPRLLRPLLRFQGAHQLSYHLWQAKAYFAARKIHSQNRLELFHHITYANDWLASFIGALLPIPYVRGPGGGAHRTPPGFHQEYPISGRIWEMVRSLGQWIFRHDPFFLMGQSRAGALLVCNQESMDKIPAKWSKKAHLFPVSGMPPQDLTIRQPAHRNDQFQVLSAGSLLRIKGFGLAIRAFKQFSEKYPATQFKIFGSGPEEPRLQALIKEAKLQDKVQIIQSIPRDDLLNNMASSDVFLFPSLRDGGGTVVIEAMAVGKPVVCLNAGGPGLHVTEECGIKITPSTPEQAVNDLAAALERLYLDEDLRRAMGEAGHRRAKQMYQWDKLGDRLMTIYEGVTQGSPTRELR